MSIIALEKEELEEVTSELLAMRQVAFLLMMFSFGESKRDVDVDVVAIAATS